MLFSTTGYTQTDPLSLEINHKKVKLSWQAGNEEHLNYYFVERSENGRQFETIAMFKGENKNEYTWYDKDITSAEVYYRVRSMYLTRETALIGAVVVFRLKENEKEISVFPDLKSTFNLYADFSTLAATPSSIEITDPDGFVMVKFEDINSSVTSCKLILPNLMQKVNCVVSYMANGKMLKNRLNIYDASLNFSDTNYSSVSGQAFSLK